MVGFPTPTVVLSECLGIRAVRYDGGIIFDEFVETLKKYVTVVPVCPEVGAGLGVPRNPLALYRDGNAVYLIDLKTGEDITHRVKRYAESFLSDLVDVDGFLLKSGSPSCGIGDSKIYGRGGAVLGRSNGLFAELARSSYPLLPFESEKRLLNFGIRRNYLTRLFAISDLRISLNNINRVETVVELHRRYKYVLMLYSPHYLKILGKLVAERSHIDLHKLINLYRRYFLEALMKNPGRGSYANVFTHLYSHLKDRMSVQERDYLKSLIDEYRVGRETLKALIAYFKGFIYRLGDKYLEEQKFLEPYPPELEVGIPI